MTRKELERTIKNKKLPKDHLDGVFKNISGNILQVILPLMTGYFLIFLEETEKSMSKGATLIWFLLASAWSTHTWVKKWKDKNLEPIHTGLSQEKNIELIEELLRLKPKYTVEKQIENCLYIHIPTWLNQNDGYTLVLIALENKLLFNLRFNGSYKGRPQMSFGIRGYRERKIKRLLKEILSGVH